MSLFSKGYPTINTERLVLREIKLSDLQELDELYNSPYTQQYQTVHHYTVQELLTYIAKQYEEFENGNKIMWALERKSDRRLIGTRILYNDGNNSYEIQGDTFKQFWQQGYTKEAYLGILRFIKSNVLHGTVYGKVQVGNTNAISLMKSLNFEMHPCLESSIPMHLFTKEVICTL